MATLLLPHPMQCNGLKYHILSLIGEKTFACKQCNNYCKKGDSAEDAHVEVLSANGNAKKESTDDNDDDFKKERIDDDDDDFDRRVTDCCQLSVLARLMKPLIMTKLFQSDYHHHHHHRRRHRHHHHLHQYHHDCHEYYYEDDN